MPNTDETLQTAAQQGSASSLVQRDAAAHNAIVGLQAASQKVSDFYGRQLVEKQREIFALRESLATLIAENAKLVGWEERSKQFEAAYNELLTKYSTLTTDVASVASDAPPPVVVSAPSSGLGDKVAAIAKAFGIKQTPGCGCAERQEALNQVSLGDGPIAAARAIARALIPAVERHSDGGR